MDRLNILPGFRVSLVEYWATYKSGRRGSLLQRSAAGVTFHSDPYTCTPPPTPDKHKGLEKEVTQKTTPIVLTPPPKNKNKETRHHKNTHTVSLHLQIRSKMGMTVGR